jgi:transcriptional regulator with XRE-family HTH domain
VDDSSKRVEENLRKIRRSQGMSLDVLAGRSGLSKSFLSRVENGQRYLDRHSHLSAVAEARSCSIADLVGQQVPTIDSREHGILTIYRNCAASFIPQKLTISHQAEWSFLSMYYRCRPGSCRMPAGLATTQK